ncbi:MULTISPECIES: hypothetical protein [Undibacterium]|uniref:Pycsar effector protein domain-containing protein n=2 Tax=Undibacterium TaxID=401469 RepID=A0ABR6YJN4_9BURK|nr:MULTISPECIES: hypothetical protein [Undibacterium]MBC3884107.1 hypothetical protein [Undibacterium griseum]MBR7792164.1 hypothetical protein [Undibacterium rivi]
MDEWKDEDRLKMYVAIAETSRKWVSVMDTKAGFLSALNAALLAFIWTGARLLECGPWSKGFALTASSLAILSLLFSLLTVIPRGSLAQIFGAESRYINDFKPISFYGYVAEYYPKGHENKFIEDVLALSPTKLCHEVLEQHYTISHGLKIKSNWVERAGWLLVGGLALTALALLAKFADF